MDGGDSNDDKYNNDDDVDINIKTKNKNKNNSKYKKKVLKRMSTYNSLFDTTLSQQCDLGLEIKEQNNILIVNGKNNNNICYDTKGDEILFSATQKNDNNNNNDDDNDDSNGNDLSQFDFNGDTDINVDDNDKITKTNKKSSSKKNKNERSKSEIINNEDIVSSLERINTFQSVEFQLSPTQNINDGGEEDMNVSYAQIVPPDVVPLSSQNNNNNGGDDADEENDKMQLTGEDLLKQAAKLERESNELRLKPNRHIKKSISTNNNDQKSEEIKEDQNNELFEQLKILRTNEAIRCGITEYRVSTHSVLQNIADTKPLNKTDLMKVKNFGKKKWNRHGKKILKLIKSYCKSKNNRNDGNHNDNDDFTKHSKNADVAPIISAAKTPAAHTINDTVIENDDSDDEILATKISKKKLIKKKKINENNKKKKSVATRTNTAKKNNNNDISTGDDRLGRGNTNSNSININEINSLSNTSSSKIIKTSSINSKNDNDTIGTIPKNKIQFNMGIRAEDNNTIGTIPKNKIQFDMGIRAEDNYINSENGDNDDNGEPAWMKPNRKIIFDQQVITNNNNSVACTNSDGDDKSGNNTDNNDISYDGCTSGDDSAGDRDNNDDTNNIFNNDNGNRYDSRYDSINNMNSQKWKDPNEPIHRLDSMRPHQRNSYAPNGNDGNMFDHNKYHQPSTTYSRYHNNNTPRNNINYYEGQNMHHHNNNKQQNFSLSSNKNNVTNVSLDDELSLNERLEIIIEREFKAEQLKKQKKFENFTNNMEENFKNKTINITNNIKNKIKPLTEKKKIKLQQIHDNLLNSVQKIQIINEELNEYAQLQKQMKNAESEMLKSKKEILKYLSGLDKQSSTSINKYKRNAEEMTNLCINDIQNKENKIKNYIDVITAMSMMSSNNNAAGRRSRVIDIVSDENNNSNKSHSRCTRSKRQRQR